MLKSSHANRRPACLLQQCVCSDVIAQVLEKEKKEKAKGGEGGEKDGGREVTDTYKTYIHTHTHTVVLVSFTPGFQPHITATDSFNSCYFAT